MGDDFAIAKKQIQRLYRKKLLFTQHAVDRMNSPIRLISVNEIREVLEGGELLQSYSDDPRGASYLLARQTSANRQIYVVCAPKEDYLLIITAYPRKGDS